MLKGPATEMLRPSADTSPVPLGMKLGFSPTEPPPPGYSGEERGQVWIRHNFLDGVAGYPPGGVEVVLEENGVRLPRHWVWERKTKQQRRPGCPFKYKASIERREWLWTKHWSPFGSMVFRRSDHIRDQMGGVAKVLLILVGFGGEIVSSRCSQLEMSERQGDILIVPE